MDTNSEHQRIAFVTGITGQDGSYLAELLLEKGYFIYGLKRTSSSTNTSRIDHIFTNPNLKLIYGDLTDSSVITTIFHKIKHDHPEMKRLEVYNLGAQSHVKISFEMPIYTGEVDALGTARLLNAIVENGLKDITRFYQASTSELYGKVQEVPQTELTPFYPRSPYGVAKLYGFWIVKNYRESYDMFACSGVLFNHESCRRGHNFVTRKITIGIGKIVKGEEDRLVLGNLDSQRDWGYAKDYVEGMYRILQADEPEDFVLATGEMYTVRHFVEQAFSRRGFDIKWKGEGVNEIGYDENTGRELIFISEQYYRPAEVDELLGDATKAREKLGWKPTTTFDELVTMMVDADCPPIV
jgi:GDPmannose 4,6-dehydratase